MKDMSHIPCQTDVVLTVHPESLHPFPTYSVAGQGRQGERAEAQQRRNAMHFFIMWFHIKTVHAFNKKKISK